MTASANSSSTRSTDAHAGRLILVSAPSGAGKTSLVQAAIERDRDLVVSISHTTRPQRPNEHDGVNYHFVAQVEFDRMVKDNAFLEHATVFDHQYGTSKAEVEKHVTSGRDVILEIDWQGADQIRAIAPECLSVFILPPSIEALAERLQQRAQDSPETIERRLSEARREIAQAGKYDYLIINDDFDTALADLLTILRAERLSTAQMTTRPAIAALLDAALPDASE